MYKQMMCMRMGKAEVNANKTTAVTLRSCSKVSSTAPEVLAGSYNFLCAGLGSHLMARDKLATQVSLAAAPL